MNKLVIAATVLLTLATGRAFAESDGDPFPFRAAPLSAHGQAFVVQTGSEAFPSSTGSTAQPSSLAQLEPASDREGVIQTASSLPRGFSGPTAVASKAHRTQEAGVTGVAG